MAKKDERTAQPDQLNQDNQTEPIDLASSRAARKQHDALVAWTKQQFTQVKNARVVTERQWYYNLAMYFGKQHVQMMKPTINTATSLLSTKFWTPPAPPWRSRPVINMIRPTIRTELAQLTANRPNASVVPASAEDRDMYAAMAAEQIWYSEYDEKKLKFIIRRAVWWMLTCGTGFIKTYWDTKRGPLNEMGVPSGDIVYTPETPFHVLCPDFREEEIENQPFLIHAQIRSPEFIKLHFEKDLVGRSFNPATADANDLLEESFLNMVGTAANKRHHTLVLEVWVKPGQHSMFPNGAMFTMVGDQIIYAQEGMAYEHGMYPFAKLDHIPAGKFYSTSVIEDLIPLQKEYNRTRGQIVEAKNRMAKPGFMAPIGSVDATKITTEPGQVVFYRPGLPAPEALPTPPLPNYIAQELERIRQDWSDISGQHEVTHGSVPPGVTAATAISYLQERDESKLAPSFDSLEEAVEKTARMALHYVHDYWTDERTVRVTGPDGSFDALAFKGSDIKGNMDIRVEGGSSLPVSKAAKQALIMDMMKMGFIQPQDGLEVLDMGGINKIYERVQVDQRQAQRENLRMSKVTTEILEQYNQQNMQIMQQDPTYFGIEESVDPLTGMPTQTPLMPPILIPTNTWDNHEMHIEYHNRFRKGQAFEQLPAEVKDLFEAHVQSHIESLGLETVTQDPRQAAGLPPLPESEEDVESEQQPGPSPMPENMEGM